MEPDDAEPASARAWATFIFVAVVSLRALARAALALRAASRAQTDVPSVVGLFSPRIIVPATLVQVFSDDEHAAVVAHETAHVRHRDPLRIWLGQLAADLQWPWPAAGERLSTWLEALEWARDDEARARGADGEALAAALLVAIQNSGGGRGCPRAALTGSARALDSRVRRLIAPLAAAPAWSTSVLHRAALVAALLAAVASGIAFGEDLVRVLLAAI